MPAIASLCLSFSSICLADDWLDGIRKGAKDEIEAAETDALFREADLSKKYIGALEGLEKKLAAEGNLDAIVHLRAEREAVEKSGSTTAHADKPLVELREKYSAGIKVIRDELGVSRKKLAAEVIRKFKDQETLLVKAGKVDDALAIRKQGDSLVAEISNPGETPKVEVAAQAESPQTGEPTELKPLKTVTLPSDKPAVNDKPFAIKGRWLESMTIPAMKQRVADWVTIGDRGKKAWVTVVISPGSVWSGNKGVALDVSAGNVLANKCKFTELLMLSDLACNFYFQNCVLDDCGFNKGGVWYGWDLAGKFYFENCLVSRRWNTAMNVTDLGFHAQTSVFEKINFPSFKYNKKQPANYVNETWLRFVNCRFVDCEIPLSVLMLTRECIFENCTFVSDKDDMLPEVISKPIEVTIYKTNCKSRISALPPNVKLTEKSGGEWNGTAIPTVESLKGMIGL